MPLANSLSDFRKVSVLTYDTPHFKTQQVLFRLLTLGIKPKVYVTNFIHRKNFVGLFKHRLGEPVHASVDQMCKNLGLQIVKGNLSECFPMLPEKKSDELKEIVLLTTGMLIPGELVDRYQFINVHPGFLPKIKGLDAIKWAIYHECEVGVTSHFVNAEIDGGIIIDKQIVPLFYEDTFHSFCQRAYEMEIAMTVEALNKTPLGEFVGESPWPTFRRMPHRTEIRMMEAFEVRRSKAKSQLDDLQ